VRCISVTGRAIAHESDPGVAENGRGMVDGRGGQAPDDRHGAPALDVGEREGEFTAVRRVRGAVQARRPDLEPVGVHGTAVRPAGRQFERAVAEEVVGEDLDEDVERFGTARRRRVGVVQGRGGAGVAAGRPVDDLLARRGVVGGVEPEREPPKAAR
jgi:hypothetical protein